MKMNKKEQIACPKCGQFKLVDKKSASQNIFVIGCLYTLAVPVLSLFFALFGLGIFGLILGAVIGIGLMVTSIIHAKVRKPFNYCLNCGYKWNPEETSLENISRKVS